MPLGRRAPGVVLADRARVPWLGRNWPLASLISVDLPAPLAPSSPVMPGPMRQLTSLTPITGP